MRENEITTITTLQVNMQVRQKNKAPKSLVGATYAATLGRGNVRRAGAVTVVDASKGLIRILFPAPAAELIGPVGASVHITLNGVTKCVWRESFYVQDTV